DPNLTREAQEIAAELVSSVPVGGIADDVCARVTRLDMDDLHGRAGKRSGGYVEPAQAAQDLLEEAVAGHLDDMKRRMDLGLDRKSTRLNSSHVAISYAVFCLKKKNTTPGAQDISATP